MTRRSLAALGVAAAAFLAGIGDARADQIDGNWYFRDGRSLSINGPQTVTPGGARMTGDYHRHGFTYVVPAAEPGAGGTVVMNQLDEQTVEVILATGAARGPVETRRRCAGTIS